MVTARKVPLKSTHSLMTAVAKATTQLLRYQYQPVHCIYLIQYASTIHLQYILCSHVFQIPAAHFIRFQFLPYKTAATVSSL